MVDNRSNDWIKECICTPLSINTQIGIFYFEPLKNEALEEVATSKRGQIMSYKISPKW
jgi:hypothetical protein